MGRDDQVKDFLNYSFDSDDKYKTWLAGVEYTSNSAETLLRLKAKYYKKNIDVNFDMSWLASIPATRPQAASNAASSARTEEPRPSFNTSQAPRNTDQYSRSDAGAGSAGAAPSGRVAQYTFMYHCTLVILTVAFTVPLFGTFSRRAYHTFMQVAIMGQGLKVYTKFGLPPLRPFSMQNLQHYLARVAPSSEFHFLVVAFLFVSGRPSTLPMLPLAIPALYSVMARLQATGGSSPLWQRYGAKLYQAMLSKQRDADMISVWAELGTLAFLVFNLLGKNRNIMLLFAYVHLLKMRYHFGDKVALHRMAWQTIVTKTAPLRAKVPVLDKYVQMAANWFVRAG